MFPSISGKEKRYFLSSVLELKAAPPKKKKKITKVLIAQ